MPTRPLRPAPCPDCQQDIVWGTFQNGRSRTFEPRPMRLAAVPPAERFAYSRRYRAMVCLDGEPNPPAECLVPHYCAAYAERRLMRNVERLGDSDLPFLRGEGGAPGA